MLANVLDKIQNSCREVIHETLREFYLARDTGRNSHPARKTEASVFHTRLNLKENRRRPQLHGSIIPRGLWDEQKMPSRYHDPDGLQYTRRIVR